MSERAASTRLIVTESPDETIELGEGLAAELSGGDVVTIDGPLGSGKTILVRGLVRGLGGDETLVGSPTFGLAHEYPLGEDLRLVHVDCYRLAGPGDLEGIGWDGFAGAGDAITVVEWAGRVQAALPAHRIHIAAGHCGDSSRAFEISKG